MYGVYNTTGLWLTILLLLIFSIWIETKADNKEIIQKPSRSQVRWLTEDYSKCSSLCGGGTQTRSVRCVRKLYWSVAFREVPRVYCHFPSPKSSRKCNTQPCTANWKIGEWSKCSESCGLGHQTRDVSCESVLWRYQPVQVSVSECGTPRPGSRRSCHLADCSLNEESKTHRILAEDYTLIQLRRLKKLKVNIGGEVRLLKGQTVVVKCPVKNYSKKLVYWSRGYRLVPFLGRVSSTSGGLKIRKADPNRDAGTYTCIAGDQTASIIVTFIRPNDEVRKTYKNWIKQKKRENKHRKFVSKLKIGKANNNSLIGEQEEANNNLKQQDQSEAKSPDGLTFVTGEWSPCSVTCGSGGYRKRKVTCSEVNKKFVKILPSEKCLEKNLKAPPTSESCVGVKECAVWKAGAWSKCQPSCGQVGWTTRLLLCVWSTTGQPAWSSCDIDQKPVTRKPCKLKPCPKVCVDKSRYCSLSILLRLCRFHKFKTECCNTCSTKQRKYAPHSKHRHRSRYSVKNNIN